MAEISVDSKGSSLSRLVGSTQQLDEGSWLIGWRSDKTLKEKNILHKNEGFPASYIYEFTGG